MIFSIALTCHLCLSVFTPFRPPSKDLPSLLQHAQAEVDVS